MPVSRPPAIVGTVVNDALNARVSLADGLAPDGQTALTQHGSKPSLASGRSRNSLAFFSDSQSCWAVERFNFNATPGYRPGAPGGPAHCFDANELHGTDPRPLWNGKRLVCGHHTGVPLDVVTWRGAQRRGCHA